VSNFDPTETYVHLSAANDATAVPVTEAFWPELMAGERDYDGRLITAHELTENMAHWERHPAGGEVLLALSGAFDVILDEAAGERRIALETGRAVIVPQGIWHRVDVRQPGVLVFVTPGEGTTHRPL
jgi:mannose-6-phosphate isomerase-like protein (cupin superfamily)